MNSPRKRALRLRGQVLVNVEAPRYTNSYGTPDFVTREFYVDRPCRRRERERIARSS